MKGECRYSIPHCVTDFQENGSKSEVHRIDEDDLPLSELKGARNTADENKDDGKLCTICRCDYRHYQLKKA
ncbi:hypothetical protein evm_010074 [Chilo suppressalis]|nr:hypothetical protein evm_010074 [Chilo suppressalis]